MLKLPSIDGLLAIRRSVAVATRRAKHFSYSEIARDVQPLPQKYSYFRNKEFMI